MTRFRIVSIFKARISSSHDKIQCKGITQGEHKYWLCKTGDPLIQVHLHCISVLGIPKCRCSRQVALNILTIKSGLTD